MQPVPPDVSICIANHRTLDLTLACLASLTAYGATPPPQAATRPLTAYAPPPAPQPPTHPPAAYAPPPAPQPPTRPLAAYGAPSAPQPATRPPTWEVLLVNNTPDDHDRLAAAVAALPQALFMQNETPLPFAANQNLLMRRARGRYLLALNSDTLLTPGALAELVAFADARPACGVVGPRLVHPDGTLQPSCRNFPTPLTHFLEASGLWQLLRNRRAVGRYYYLCSPHDEPQAVDWLTGACLLVRAEVFTQTGGFDELHFGGMYGEDIDWCRRIRTGGWEIWFDPAAQIVHAESASPLARRTLQMYKGFYRYCALHMSKGDQRAVRVATRLALTPRLLAGAPQHRALYRQIMQLPVE